MIVAIGTDHAGVPLREVIADVLADGGHRVADLGTCGDYPEIALRVGRAVARGEADRGILVCGSGAGVGVAASKLPGIRAQTIHDTYTAHQAVEHDGVNVLCLGGRVIGTKVAGELVAAFIRARVSGEERHVRRRAKVDRLERDGFDAVLED